MYVLWKELRVSLLCGAALALVTFVRIVLLNHQPAVVALVVALSLIVTVVTSKLIGGLLPMAAWKLGMDPAVMASPLITTVVDATSLWTFFMGMGFVLNVGLQNRNFLTRNEELLKKKDVYEHRMHRM